MAPPRATRVRVRLAGVVPGGVGFRPFHRLLNRGDTRVAAVSAGELERRIPGDERVSVGWWGAGRGWLTHHLVMERAGSSTTRSVIIRVPATPSM